MQVPRTVEKQVPYTYTVRKPRTVVMRVPLDPCGNPLPAAAPRAPSMAPSAAARPTAPAAEPAPAAQPKTFSDAPAAAMPKAPEGWGGSELKHIDPEAAGAIRARRPVENDLEPISTPEAKSVDADSQATPRTEPTVAPPGPAVEPAPPQGSTRDVPAAETSAAPYPTVRGGHTT